MVSLVRQGTAAQRTTQVRAWSGKHCTLAQAERRCDAAPRALLPHRHRPPPERISAGSRMSGRLVAAMILIWGGEGGVQGHTLKSGSSAGLLFERGAHGVPSAGLSSSARSLGREGPHSSQ